MKLSTKLLIGLLGVFLVMMLISAFSVKSEFEKINLNDPYWEFVKASDKSFKHIKIIGEKGADGKVNIIEDKSFAVNVSKKWENDVKVSFVGDTVVIKLKKYSNKNKAGYYNFENTVTILCPDLSSIRGELAHIKIDSLNQDNLKIEANNATMIDVRKLNSKNLTISLETNSNCEFRNDMIYKLENLEANIAPNATLKMRQVYPSNLVLNTSDKSIIEMNGTALNAIKK